MKKQKVSVIIPCYNYATYLGQCIDSVLACASDQYEIEIIVINDGSTDETERVANIYSKHIRYIYQDNAGLSAARNTGMAAATGDFLLFLDADDLLTPNVIASQLAVFQEHPETDIVVCLNNEVLSMGSESPLAPIGSWPLFKSHLHVHLCHFNVAPPHASIIRKEKALLVGVFDTSLKACEDYDFWVRCAQHKMIFRTNSDALVIYRKHAHSMSAQKGNQLFHDYLMHGKIAQMLQADAEFVASNECVAWVAHASGCLVTAFRIFNIDKGKAFDLFQQSLHSVIESVKYRKSDDALQEILNYYINKIFLHLSFFSSLKNQHIEKIQVIFSKLYPHLACDRQTAEIRESRLIHQVHYPQKSDALSIASLDSTHRAGTKRVLLGSDFFWPSRGGCELFLEDLGTLLIEQGYDVHVATRSIPERNAFIRNGMHIIQFHCSGRFQDGALGEQYNAYAHFIQNAQYDAIFIIGQPDTWLHAPLLAQEIANIHLIPIINPELLDDWTRHNQTHLTAAVLHRAKTCIRLTESGLDARFLQSLNLQPLFLPHALTSHPARPGFREHYKLKKDVPLLVHVANFWPLKNQLALVQTLASTPGNWQLALIGVRLPWPGESAYHDEVAALAASDSRIHMLGPLEPAEADAAIAAADILLLPSKAECRPLVILQAMQHGVPWIATPECNSVHNDAGGLVCPLSRFPAAIATLLAHPPLRIALGTLGQEHFQQCFTWEKVLPLFLDLIEDGETSRTITQPSGIMAAQQQLVKKIMQNCSL